MDINAFDYGTQISRDSITPIADIPLVKMEGEQYSTTETTEYYLLEIEQLIKALRDYIIC